MEAMLGEMTASEFAGWCEFYSLEPWGFYEDRARMAIIASTIANFAGKVAKHEVSAIDFMPEDARPTKQQSLVEKIKAAFGGR